VLLEEESGPTSAKSNLENILHKGESATHEMDAILKKKHIPPHPYSRTYDQRQMMNEAHVPLGIAGNMDVVEISKEHVYLRQKSLEFMPFSLN